MLAAILSIRMLGLFMVLPVISLYQGKLFDATPFLLGVALGAYGLTQALLQIPLGAWSDRIGRKPVIFFGLALFVVGSVIAALSTSIYGVIIGRCLQGAGAISSTLMAMVADATQEHNRVKAMAIMGGSIGVSFGLALVIGPLLNSWFGLSGLFWVTALLGAASMLMLAMMPQPVQASTNGTDVSKRNNFISVLKNLDLMRLNVGIFALHFVLMAGFVVLPRLFVNDLGIPAGEHWAYYLPIVVLAFIAMLPFIIVAEKRQKMKPVFLIAIVAVIASQLLFLVSADAGNLMLAWVFLFFVGFNLLEAMLPSLISKQAPAGGRGAAMGVYSTSQFLGAFFGASIGGWLVSLSGDFSLLFVVTALLTVVWLLFASGMHQPRYLTEHVLAVQQWLEKNSVAELQKKLLALSGVVEVSIFEADQVAHIKFDKQKLDDESTNILFA